MKLQRIKQFLRAEPYWLVIILFWLIAGTYFVRHLATEIPPNRVAFTIPVVALDVYWYGIVITGGIIIGSWVVSYLAQEKGKRIWEATVPAATRHVPLSQTSLPADIVQILHKNKIITLGELLLWWGFNPIQLGLNRVQQKQIYTALKARKDVPTIWLDDAPWRQWNPEHVWNGVTWCVILAIIGARLYHVLTPPPSMAAVGIESPLDYFRQPYQLINLRAGGLGIYGGIVGGVLGLIIYTYRHKLSALAWLDLAGVGLALGQAMGRWGNFLNQELYGAPTSLPWAIPIERIYRPDAFLEEIHFHPAFLYESLWNFLAFIVLYLLARNYYHKWQTGDLMALYLIFYGTGRILTELVRLDSPTIFIGTQDTGIPIAMGVSIAIIIGSVGWRTWHYRRQRISRLSPK